MKIHFVNKKKYTGNFFLEDGFAFFEMLSTSTAGPCPKSDATYPFDSNSSPVGLTDHLAGHWRR